MTAPGHPRRNRQGGIGDQTNPRFKPLQSHHPKTQPARRLPATMTPCFAHHSHHRAAFVTWAPPQRPPRQLRRHTPHTAGQSGKRVQKQHFRSPTRLPGRDSGPRRPRATRLSPRMAPPWPSGGNKPTTYKFRAGEKKELVAWLSTKFHYYCKKYKKIKKKKKKKKKNTHIRPLWTKNAKIR